MGEGTVVLPTVAELLAARPEELVDMFDGLDAVLLQCLAGTVQLETLKALLALNNNLGRVLAGLTAGAVRTQTPGGIIRPPGP